MNLPAPSYERFLNIYNSYINNPFDAISDFEHLLAKFFTVDKTSTFSNCFTALALALKYYTKNRENTVAIAGLSYRRTTDIVLWAGLEPLYIDNDLVNLGMSYDRLKDQLEKSTIGCVLLQHPMVNLVDVKKFISICNYHEVPILIDSVEATGGTLYGRKIGSIGNIEGFSLHPSKVINGAEGGILTFSNICEYNLFNEYMEKIGVYSKITKQDSLFNLEPVHAILGMASLECFGSFRKKFEEQYLKYFLNFKANESFEIIKYDSKEKNNFKSILVRIKNKKINRAELLKHLEKNLIGARPYYYPLHSLSKRHDIKNARILSESLIFLPIGKSVKLKDIDFISKMIINYGKKF